MSVFEAEREGYTVAMTVGGVRFTGPHCDTEAEADALKQVLETDNALEAAFEVTET
jgi:hypothetical protein